MSSKTKTFAAIAIVIIALVAFQKINREKQWL